jgi:hypothetical protein
MFPPPTTDVPTTTPAAMPTGEAAIAVPAGEIPPVDSPEFDEMFDTRRFQVVEQTTPTQEQLGVAWEAGAADFADTTDAVPRITTEAPFVAAAPPPRGVPLRATMLLLAIATAAVAVTSAFLTNFRYRVSGDVNASVRVGLNGISTNARVGTIIAAVLLIAGAAIGMSGRRFGTGLAGGAGLALAGFMAWLVGDSISVIDTLKQGFRESSLTYTLSTTLDVGFWMAVSAAVLGGVVFAVSLAGAGDDGEPSLHPAVGAFGLIGGLVLVIGPMLPTKGATFADNFTSDHSLGPARFWKGRLFLEFGITHDAVPPITTWLRILVLLLLLIGVYLGFIAGSKWGVGMVLGAVGIGVWQWVTAMLEAGDLPWVIAGGSPGQEGFTPNVATSVGVVIVVVTLVVAAVLAYRPRRNAAATS